jgi:Secretion system C-terminal sorting domain
MKNVCMLLLPAVVMIVFAGNTFAQSRNALPVLVTVNANLTNANQVAISWTMLAKVNTDYFDVEKSNDGISWKSIATVKPYDSTAIPFTYTAFDMFPLKGSNFYRVRLNDLDGSMTFTAIKNVRVTAFCNATIYPNPASGLVNILLGQLSGTDWHISIINNTGQLMTMKNFSKNTTTASLSVNNYPAGNYILKITDGHSVQSNRLMINHN